MTAPGSNAPGWARLSLVVGLSLFASAMVAWRGIGHELDPNLVLPLAALGAFFVLLAVRRNGSTGSTRSALLVTAGYGACAFCAARLIEPWAVRQPDVPFLASAANWLLEPWVACAVTEDRELAVQHQDGLILFRPTAFYAAAPVGITFFALLVARNLSRLRPIRALVMDALLLVAVGLARYTFLVLRFVSVEDPLARRAPIRTFEFVNPHETRAWMLLAALLVAARPFRARVQSPVRAHRASTWMPALGIVVGTSVVSVSYVHPWRGSESEGRVLIDDRFSDDWAPSARRMTPTWFGDFSTYGLSAAVELLSHHFAVTVNTSQEYTPALLDDFDVLVLKTPVLDIPSVEREAIRSWVREGGGLFLIGDHTDLLGMSGRLNDFAQDAGLRFRFDSVLAAESGGFTLYRRPRVGAHPALRRVNALEFMTGCSVEYDSTAEPAMLVRNQVRQDHDWAGPSNFGLFYGDPSMHHGPLALAASGRSGQGRVLAFGDSTILSSFALFLFNRDRFLVDAVGFLNTRVVPRSRSLALLLAGLSSGIVGLLVFVRSRGATLGWPGAMTLIAIGAISGEELSDQVVARAAWSPAPITESPRLAWFLPGCEVQLPPVIGALPSGVELESSYDTLLSAIPRWGVFPRPIGRVADGFSDSALLILDPSIPLREEVLVELDQWVRGGGSLVVAWSSDHAHLGAIRPLLDIGGIQVLQGPDQTVSIRGVDVLPSPDRRIGIARCDHGQGTIVTVVGSQHWSRLGLGHSFAIPGAEERGAYAALGTVLEECPGLVPSAASRRTYRIL